MAFIIMSPTALSTHPRTSWVKAGLGKTALKSAIGAALAMGVLGAGQAQAVVVTVNGQQWNVTTVSGSYDSVFGVYCNDPGSYNTPGGVLMLSQPWFSGAGGD